MGFVNFVVYVGPLFCKHLYIYSLPHHTARGSQIEKYGNFLSLSRVSYTIHEILRYTTRRMPSSVDITVHDLEGEDDIDNVNTDDMDSVDKRPVFLAEGAPVCQIRISLQ